MKTLYNENFYNIKGVASNSALIFIFPFVGVFFYFSKGLISLNFFILSGLIYGITINFLRKNRDFFVAFTRIFLLKKENFYSKDFIFDFMDNIHQKYYKIVENSKNTNKNVKNNKTETISNNQKNLTTLNSISNNIKKIQQPTKPIKEKKKIKVFGIEI